MATKKQKREALLKKREKFEEECRRDGLKAQRMDQARRARKNLEVWEEQHNKKHSWRKRVDECPHCQIAIQEAKKNAVPESEEPENQEQVSEAS